MAQEEKLPIGRIVIAKEFCSDWIAEHGKLILGIVSVIIVLLCAVLPFVSRKRFDYLAAQAAYSAWASAATSDSKLFEELEKPLSANPELEIQFGSLIAQRCLILNDYKKAETYAKAALHRTRKLLLPYYSSFSKNSCLIAKGEFRSALAEAKKLREEMRLDEQFWKSRDPIVRSGHLLYAYNLLRIATLEKEVGSVEGELAAWNEFLSEAGWGDVAPSFIADPEAYEMLAQVFQDGGVSLKDFIHARKQQLAEVASS